MWNSATLFRTKPKQLKLSSKKKKKNCLEQKVKIPNCLKKDEKQNTYHKCTSKTNYPIMLRTTCVCVCLRDIERERDIPSFKTTRLILPRRLWVLIITLLWRVPRWRIALRRVSCWRISILWITYMNSTTKTHQCF